MRRTTKTTAGWLALVALAAACSESQGEAAQPPPRSAALEIPTPEQALQHAAETIDAENADAELERLKREIEGS